MDAILRNQWILVMRSNLANVLTYLEDSLADERIFRHAGRLLGDRASSFRGRFFGLAYFDRTLPC